MKENIKIVGIISSSNHRGNTAALVSKVLKGAEEEGAEVTEVFLSDYNLKFCTGCLICNSKGKCHMSDNFEVIREIIYEADGVIIGSPTYALEYNSLMKCFFERLGTYTQYASLLGGKYVVGISTAYSESTAKKVAKKLTDIFKFGIFQRSFVSGYLGVGTMFKGVEKKTSENNYAMEKANGLGIKITKDIINKNKYPFQNLIMRLVTAIYLKPIFKKSVLKHKDDNQHAIFVSLSQRGLI